MSKVGIRSLKQNASAVVARAKAGESITITDRGRPVARLVPIGERSIDLLIEAGLATPPGRDLMELPPPVPGTPDLPSLSEVIDEERADRL